MATLHNSAPLLLSLFLPDTVAAFYLDHFSVLWYLGCFSIPPNPRGRFLRRLVFGAGFEHICSLAVASWEGPVRGLRSQGCISWAVEAMGSAFGGEACCRHAHHSWPGLGLVGLKVARAAALLSAKSLALLAVATGSKLTYV